MTLLTDGTLMVKPDKLCPGDVWRGDWPMEPDLLALCLWNRQSARHERVRLIGFVWVVFGEGSTGRQRGVPIEWEFDVSEPGCLFVHASSLTVAQGPLSVTG